MHDIDRTSTGYETGTNGFETDQFEYDYTAGVSGESPFNEQEEIDLAAELMGVTSDAELDQFLGDLVKKAWKGMRKVVPHVLRGGRTLAKIARPALKQALPGLAQAVAPMASQALAAVPYAGPALALAAPFAIPALGKSIADALEMEFEGLNSDEYEFEAAKRYVRILGSAAQQLAQQARSDVSPIKAAGKALMDAARQHVPGLAAAVSGTNSTSRSGRWVRRGSEIVLLGV